MDLLPAFTSPPERNRVYVADSLDYLRSIPRGSVDLVVTSPPYNMGTNINGAEPCSKSAPNWGRSKLLSSGYEDYNDAMPHAEYISWQREILHELMRVIDDSGAIFYNHKWRIQGGLLDMRSEIVRGFPVRQIIIWNRGTSNNHNRAFFAPQYEVVYLIAKRGFYINQSSTAFGDVWNINPEYGNEHPAPFPLELAERCIASTTARVILDPFMGSGTTAQAAKNLKRDYMGCDKSPKYVQMTNERLAPIPQPIVNADGSAQLALFTEVAA